MANHTREPIRSIDTNIIGTANVACTCIKHELKLVYISTDYVYPGTDGDYCEFDPVLPINDYAWSKLGGECSARMVPNHLIIRSAHSPRPFRHEKAVIDCIKSGIYVDDAAKLILKMLHNGTTGIVNLGGPASTVYDFAKESRPDVVEILRSDIKETIPNDVSMNLRKLYDSTI
jgi:dTDP-4-dehydrorhamnose reductase